MFTIREFIEAFKNNDRVKRYQIHCTCLMPSQTNIEVNRTAGEVYRRDLYIDTIEEQMKDYLDFEVMTITFREDLNAVVLLTFEPRR